jgi:hypothetical protein
MGVYRQDISEVSTARLALLKIHGHDSRYAGLLTSMARG